jgi:hypothetical protein
MKALLLTFSLFLSVGLFAQSNGKVGVDNNDISVSLYPNPASDFLNINVKGNLVDGSVKILSALGTEVYAESLDNFKKIDLSDLKNNVYIVNVYSKDELVQTSRFVVRH